MKVLKYSRCDGGWLAAAALVLAACNTVPVAEQLDQRQALEITALLNTHGIKAESARDRQAYAVKVKRSAYAQAVGLLRKANLPAEARMSFRDLIGEPGLIPSSRDVEAVRLDHALAAELEDLLEMRPEVSAARVVVRLNYRKEQSSPGAAVVVRTRPGKTIAAEDIIGAAIKVLPGLSREGIAVAIEPEDETLPSRSLLVGADGVPLRKFLWWQVPAANLEEITATFFAVAFLAAGLGLLAGFGWGAYRQAKHLASREVPEGTPLLAMKADRPERSKRSLLGG